MNMNVDIDVEDILWEASKKEKEKLFMILLDEFKDKKESIEFIKAFLDNDLVINSMNNMETPGEIILNKNLIKISNSYLRLSKEDENIIEEIARKY